VKAFGYEEAKLSEPPWEPHARTWSVQAGAGSQQLAPALAEYLRSIMPATGASRTSLVG